MFLVVDEETDRFYKNKQVRLGASLATVKHLPHKPRIVELTKGSDGYGFFLRKLPKIAGQSEVSEVFGGSREIDNMLPLSAKLQTPLH